jgi:hypothetical protein
VDASAPDTTAAHAPGGPKRKFALGRKTRLALGAGLALAFVISISWILIAWPIQLMLWIALAVAAGGLLAVFVGLVWPRGTLSGSLVAGATCTGLLSALLAVPVIQDPRDHTISGSPLFSSTAPASPTPSELDPFTANLRFGQVLAPCEGFMVNKKFLRSMPKPKDVNAEWAYGNGGATKYGKMILTIQGRSRSAVVLEAVRIVDFERNPAPDENVEVIPCFPGGGLQTVRYFEVDLDKRPKIIPRPSDPIPPDDKVEPAVKFPFKVSRSDPEVFEMWVDGPECLCSWRLAIDWTSEGRSGTTIVDRGFDKIKINTTKNLPTYFYDSDAGSWVPPLPQ